MTKAQNESALLRSICDLFDLLGIHYYRNHQGFHTRGRDRGRPDLEAIYKGITYYIETKHPKTGGKMSRYQLEHQAAIVVSGAPYIKAVSLDDVIKGMGLPVEVGG